MNFSELIPVILKFKELLLVFFVGLFILIQFAYLVVRLRDGYVDMVDPDGFSGGENLSIINKIKFYLKVPIKRN